MSEDMTEFVFDCMFIFWVNDSLKKGANNCQTLTVPFLTQTATLSGREERECFHSQDAC